MEALGALAGQRLCPAACRRSRHARGRSLKARINAEAPPGSPAAAASPAASAAAPTTLPEPASQPPASQAIDAADSPLGTADLERYLQQHGIAASIAPPLKGAPAPAGCVEVKSLLFLADAQPLVLVLPLAARVDERRLAALLHTGRNRVRLAPAGSVMDLCGYSIGNVPPFGHRQQLPVILDSSVAAYSSCYAGGGSEGAEIFLSVRELIRAAAATVAPISKPAAEPAGYSSPAGSSAGQSRSSRGHHHHHQQQDRDEAAAAGAAAAGAASAAPAGAAVALPLPWRPGQEHVELSGVIAHRRKIARLLMFANLVPLEAAAAHDASSAGAAGAAGAAAAAAAAGEPEGAPEVANPAAAAQPAPGTAAFLRRVWRHPETGSPCEVQLILGKTLERRLGSDAAAALLRSLRTGQHVRVTGRAQPHFMRPDREVPERVADVCDLVVSDIEILPSPPPAQLASSSSSSNGSGLAALSQAPSRASSSNGSATRSASSRSSSGSKGASAAAAGAGYRLPAAVEGRVFLVDSAEGLDLLEAALFSGLGVGGDGRSSSAGSSSSNGNGAEQQPRGFGPTNSSSSRTTSSSSTDGAPGPASAADYRLVVGVDCEWQPYQRGDPRTPVSLLQLATADQVFLLDLLALCGGGGGYEEQASEALNGSGSSSGIAGSNGSEPSPTPLGAAAQPSAAAAAPPLPPLQRRLSGLLARLWGDAGIVKAGFGLSTDLQRLCESYPWLPCFGGEGPVPLRSHVDLLLLARTVLGPCLSSSLRRRVSLALLAELVLVCPLDKSQQCSEWGARPLTPEQLQYAAADAHCLVAMHRELLRRMPGVGTPFWVAACSGRLTDVAAFHPSKLRSTGSRSPSTSGSSSSSVHRSSGVPRRQLAAARETPDGAAGGDKRQGQTHALDCNVDYLLQTYLGRQLPQGGKAAVVRAAAAFTGRPEPGRTPSFPRGCGGLLEWRNAFLLFVNLPEQNEAASAGRRYPNQFLWLEQRPPAESGQAPAAAEGGQQQQGGREQQGEQQAEQQADQQQPGQQAERRASMLCMTWWPGRGQTQEHPAIRRLLAAGSQAALPAAAPVGSAGSGAGGLLPAAVEAKGDAAAPSSSSGVGMQEGESEARQEEASSSQQSVLLFCRAGGQPYVFCGRLAVAAVGLPPGTSSSAAAAALGTEQGGEAGIPAGSWPASNGSSGGSNGSSGSGPCCITWQLLDGEALLEEGGAFRSLLPSGAASAGNGA